VSSGAVGAPANEEIVGRFGRSDQNGRLWPDRRLQPKTAFSRLPPIHWADLKGQHRVDLTRSPSCQRMTARAHSGPSRLRAVGPEPAQSGPSRLDCRQTALDAKRSLLSRTIDLSLLSADEKMRAPPRSRRRVDRVPAGRDAQRRRYARRAAPGDRGRRRRRVCGLPAARSSRRPPRRSERSRRMSD
jgi:hypothetical protein